MTEPPLHILFEDAHVLAVAKPAGLLTQGSRRRRADPGRRRAAAPRRPGTPGPSTWGRSIGSTGRSRGSSSGRRRPRRRGGWRRSSPARGGKEYWAVVEATAAAWRPGRGLGRLAAPSPTPTGSWRLATAGAGRARAVTRVPARGRGDACRPRGLLWLRSGPRRGGPTSSACRPPPRAADLGDVAYGSTRPFPTGIALHARSLTFRHPSLRRAVTVRLAPCPPPGRGGDRACRRADPA